MKAYLKVLMVFSVIFTLFCFGMSSIMAKEPAAAPGKFGSAQFAPKQGFRFAVVTVSTAVAYWVPVRQGMKDAATMLGCKSEHLGPPDYKPEEVIAIMENLLKSGIDGASLFVTETGMFDKVIKDYMDAGVPIILMPGGYEDAEKWGLAFIGQHHYTAGLAWGERIVKILGPNTQGKEVIFVTEAPGQNTLELRMKGAQEGLDKAGIKYKVLDGTTDREKSYAVIENAFRANPKIVGIFAPDTTGTPAGGLFVKNNKLQGKVFVGGFDLVPDALQGIKEGYIDHVIDQYPYLQGYLVIHQLYLKKTLGLEPFTHFIPAAFITKENVDQAISLSQKGFR
jgi:simple sugar transport system substrate-binding protein